MSQVTRNEPLLQIFDRIKKEIWLENANRSETERQQLWTRRQAELASLIDKTCRPSNSQCPAHVPRTVSYELSMAARQPSAQALIPSIDRGQNLSTQSAPATVSMSRTSSMFAGTNDNFSLGPNRTPLGGWYVDAQDDSIPNYTLNSTTRDAQSYQASLQPLQQSVDVDVDVDVAVYEPSDYLLTIPDQSALNSMQNDSLYFQQLGTSDDTLSLGTSNSGELCSDSTLTSQLSRQSSLAANSLNDAFDMVRVQSNISSFSNLGFDAELSPITLSSSEKANGSPPIAFTESQQSHLLSHCNFSNEEVSASRQFPSSVSPQSSFFSNQSVEDMDRSLSEESSASQSSIKNRVHRRRQEQIAQGARPIAPKSDNEAVALLRQQPEHKMVRIESQDGTSKHVAAIRRAPYVRPQHPKITCKLCNDHPDGFRGEHELRRHTERVHARMRKVWITVDVSPDKKFLASCKACRNGKRYGVYYNAAAHLRRAHFAPRKRGRKCKGDEKRGGKAGGDWPPMDWLKQQGWLQEVEELVPDNVNDKSSEDSDGLSSDLDAIQQQPTFDAHQSANSSFAHLSQFDPATTAPWYDHQALPNTSFKGFNAMQFDPSLSSASTISPTIAHDGYSILDAHMACASDNTNIPMSMPNSF